MEFQENQLERTHVFHVHSGSLHYFYFGRTKKKVKSIFLNIQHSRQECLNSCDSSHQFSLFKCMSFALGKRHESQAKYVLPELCFSNKLQPASLCLAQILIAFHLNSAFVPTFQSYYLLANFKLSLKTNVFIEEHLKRSHFGIKDAEQIKAKEEAKEGVWSVVTNTFPKQKVLYSLFPRRWHLGHRRIGDLQLYVYEVQQSPCSGKIKGAQHYKSSNTPQPRAVVLLVLEPWLSFWSLVSIDIMHRHKS